MLTPHISIFLGCAGLGEHCRIEVHEKTPKAASFAACCIFWPVDVKFSQGRPRTAILSTGMHRAPSGPLWGFSSEPPGLGDMS